MPLKLYVVIYKIDINVYIKIANLLVILNEENCLSTYTFRFFQYKMFKIYVRFLVFFCLQYFKVFLFLATLLS